MKTGIYSIYCIANRKVYIGQAVNIHKRWHNHRTDLRRGVHKNPHLQRAWDLYGEDSFAFSVLLICDKEQLNDNERYYIESYKAIDSELGFNMCLQCDKEKNNKKKDAPKIRKTKKVVLLDKETGEHIRTENSIREVSEALRASLKILQEVILRKKKFSYKGYILVYEQDYDPNIDYRHLRKPRPNKRKLKEKKKREGSHNEIPIIIEKDEIKLEFKSIAKAARHLNTKAKNIYRCLNGERSNHKGYKFYKKSK